MRKRFMKLSVLLLVATFVSSGFSSVDEIYSSPMFTSDIVGEPTNVPLENEVDLNPKHAVPYVGKSYKGFCHDLGFSESSNNYRAVNRLGYVGKYQFGWSALRWVGVNSKSVFLSNPDLQESAFKALIAKNKFVLRDYIATYAGKTVGGIKVTESGLIAAAHLGGAGNVMKFLKSNGENVFADANNVPITKYMKQFANYDLSLVPANANASAIL
jgi:hypothetical protein